MSNNISYSGGYTLQADVAQLEALVLPQAGGGQDEQSALEGWEGPESDQSFLKGEFIDQNCSFTGVVDGVLQAEQRLSFK